MANLVTITQYTLHLTEEEFIIVSTALQRKLHGDMVKEAKLVNEKLLHNRALQLAEINASARAASLDLIKSDVLDRVANLSEEPKSD